MQDPCAGFTLSAWLDLKHRAITFKKPTNWPPAPMCSVESYREPYKIRGPGHSRPIRTFPRRSPGIVLTPPAGPYRLRRGHGHEERVGFDMRR
jgi:hypothetical protein